jgi:phosphate transport system substrate-binding protein
MKSRNIKITSTIVLALLFAGIMAQTIGFGGIGRQLSQPRAIQQAPTPLNLAITLSASGATFPIPLITQYAAQYHASNPNVTITYAGGGSGRGQRDTMNKTVDFAGSDAPLSTSQRVLTPGILHIPETIGSVVPAYNLTGIATGLHLNGSTLANIYLGNIVNWNDPAIQQQNPGTSLPAQAIKVAHRSDSSGTTFIWTSFLCLDDTTWCSTVGVSTAVTWPVGVGASGNLGVATYVKNTPFALGYVELNYALQNSMTFAAVKNPAGNYILASLQTTSWAVSNSTATLPPGSGDWSSVSLLNAAGAQTYPIASFTYFLVYQELNVVPTMDLTDGVQANALKAFLNWVITTGQTFAPALSYVPLPPAVVSIDQASINSMTFTDISTPASQTVNLSVGPSGWSQTSLTVTTQDPVTLNLLSTDGLSHQWYIDFNNNGVLDSNEMWTTMSPVFSSTTTPTVFTFKPVIWFQEGIPAAGTYAFRDSQNAALTGTIIVRPQQTAAVLTPGSTLTSTLAPVVDNSRVSTIGTLLIDQRTKTVSGLVSAVAVDKTSGSITYSKTYNIPGLHLLTTTSTDLTLSFVLNLAVLPYALSTDVTATLHNDYTAVTSRALSREVDIAAQGSVNIVDLATVAVHFGTTLGGAGYDPASDINADGAINILDLAFVAFYFGDSAFR